MKDSELLKIWAALFILCGLLGFIPEPEGLCKALMVLLAALFFVPGGMLLYRAYGKGNERMLRWLRNLSIASLATTFALLLLNFLSVMFTEGMGNFLYGLLVVLSSPMVCSGFWAASMFCWALIMTISISGLKKAKKG